MSEQLDLSDIQGNIVKAYGRYGYPMARYFFFRIKHSAGAREFVSRVAPLITTAVPWGERQTIPPVTTNIAFTYEGLKRLQIPEVTLHGFPEDFSMGMKARRAILGDTGRNYFTNWDDIWWKQEGLNKYDQLTHIFMSINGRLPTEPVAAKEEETRGARWANMVEEIDRHFNEILEIAATSTVDGEPGVELMRGNKGEDDRYQLGVALPDGKEHFGYADGISSTYFKGSGDDPSRVIGGGKPTGKDPSKLDGWEPIETGEFLLGHRDEACEYPPAPGPPLFSRNGTYMVYRKLHENVASFNRMLNEAGAKFPEGKEAFAAKLVGRWRNGAPLAAFPTEESADAFDREYRAVQVRARNAPAAASDRARYEEMKLQFRGFDYMADIEGACCPVGSHMRRANPRSALTFGAADAFDTQGALSNRRRILRRGLPYGRVEETPTDEAEHGVALMILNVDLKRQFEFVQQQWMNFGNDFRLGNDQDPILGNHGGNKTPGGGNGRMVIQGDKANGKPPYFCAGIPTLVETRGGDYYFIPSMTCLRMIGRGLIDPT